MQHKTKAATADEAALPRIPADLLEQLIPGPVTPGQLEEDIFGQFKKAFIERALGTEMSQHLGCEPGQAKSEGALHHRNGKSAKRVLSDTGALAVEVPRDRHGAFEPQRIGKHARHPGDLDREHAKREVLDEGLQRPEDPGLRWHPDRRHRWARDMGLAVAVVYPATTLQTCIVHLIRNSPDYASWKDRKAPAAVIKPICTAPSAEAALAERDAFEHGQWGAQFPTVVASWRRAWDKVSPFLAFAPEVRRVIYTTNAIKSVNAQLRKIIKTRGHFPTERMRPPS